MNQAAGNARRHSGPWLLPGAAIAAYSAAVALMPSAAMRGVALLPPLVAASGWWLLRDAQRWVIVFLCAALALPPLPIRVGDSGPHIAAAIAALGLLAGIVRAGEWRAWRRTADLALPAYGVALLISLAPAALYSGANLALASLARIALFGLSIYVYFYAAYGPRSDSISHGDLNNNWRRSLRWLYAAALLSAAFACLDFYYQFPTPAGFGAQYVWMQSGVYRRAQGVFYEASTLGNVCACFLVLTAVCIARKAESPVRRLILLGGGAILLAALMLSFSRASLINVAVSCCVLLWLERRRVGWVRLIAVGTAGLAVSLAILYMAAPQTLEFYFVRLQWSAVFLFEGRPGVLSGRLESWLYLLQFLAGNPWHALFGVGYKTLAYSTFAGKPVVADNAYLSALVETGIVGLAALLGACIAILKLAWRAARSMDPSARLFGTWIACFWVGQMAQMFSGDLFTYWRALPVYFWALGMAVRAADAESGASRLIGMPGGPNE